MKKILTITLVCLLILSGCEKQETKPNETKEPEKKYLTKMKMNIKLTEYGKEIYKDEKYKIVEKKDGIYFLSLNTLKEKLGYDISMMVNPNTHKSCDMEKTGIGVDVDNLKNYEYREEPLLIYLYCD